MITEHERYEYHMSTSDIRHELAWTLREIAEAANGHEFTAIARRVAAVIRDIDRGALAAEVRDAD